MEKEKSDNVTFPNLQRFRITSDNFDRDDYESYGENDEKLLKLKECMFGKKISTTQVMKGEILELTSKCCTKRDVDNVIKLMTVTDDGVPNKQIKFSCATCQIINVTKYNEFYRHLGTQSHIDTYLYKQLALQLYDLQKKFQSETSSARQLEAESLLVENAGLQKSIEDFMSINDEQKILIKKLQDENRLLQEQINLSINLHSASSEYPGTSSTSTTTVVSAATVSAADSDVSVATDADKNTPINNISQSYTTDYADDSEFVDYNYTSYIDYPVALDSDSDNIACQQQQSSLDINSLLSPHFGRDNHEDTIISDDDDINAQSTIDQDSQILDLDQLLPLNFGIADTSNHVLVASNTDACTHSGIHRYSSNSTKRSRLSRLTQEEPMVNINIAHMDCHSFIELNNHINATMTLTADHDLLLQELNNPWIMEEEK